MLKTKGSLSSTLLDDQHTISDTYWEKVLSRAEQSGWSLPAFRWLCWEVRPDIVEDQALSEDDYFFAYQLAARDFYDLGASNSGSYEVWRRLAEWYLPLAEYSQMKRENESMIDEILRNFRNREPTLRQVP